MRLLIQRVKKASVSIEGSIYSKINNGLLVFLGIEEEDDSTDIKWLVEKLLKLRIFDDDMGIMNLSVTDIAGDILVVSQFTLYASTRKGARPSYIRAARPEQAIPLYEEFLGMIAQKQGKAPSAGAFGANMAIELINDGPVTIWVDSKHKE
ncbi:MAG: D-tyrosyl-tRNA(Tyr) deacylase [Bacteroidales bacterium]|nr:D-tyrosyl-tRNA(Tyr) deacylase [Bacteroidales bacterium]